MAVPLLDLHEQHAALMPQIRDAFERVVTSGQFILGPFVERFEQQLAEHARTRHAIGVTSGTDALLVAMMAMGIGPGDEVITTPFTFFCTAGCVARLGARPVFVDIDPATYNIDVNQIEDAITDATKAIIPVHLFGLSADMERIMRVARDRDLPVIEDAAQAMGARHHDAVVGSIGDVGCVSFYPTKNLAGLGDAGAVVTDDDDLARRMRELRVHGSGDGVYYPHVGGNFRLDAMQAALLGVKMQHLDSWTEKRRGHAARYGELLRGLPVVTPIEPTGYRHVYNQYTIRVPDGRRDALCEHLNKHGVGCRVYYPVPLHLQPCFAHLDYAPGRFPHAERAANEVLSIPVYPEMSAEQQDEAVACIAAFYDSR